MRLANMVALSFLLAMTAGAQTEQSQQALNVKTGLWQVNSITQTNGVSPIPSQMLDKLTPEQRARIEQRMAAQQAQGPQTRISSRCVMQQQVTLDSFISVQGQCQRKVITSSSNKLEVSLQCPPVAGATRSGKYVIQTTDPEDATGTLEIDTQIGAKTSTMNINFTAKWMSASCSEKP